MLGLHTGQRPSLRLRETPAVSPNETMSYALPQTGPTQRHTHAPPNGAAQESTNGGLGERLSNMISGSDKKAELPMYKDKPFQYPSSSRNAPWYRRRRIQGGAVMLLLVLLWFSGIFSSKKTAVKIPGQTIETAKPVVEVPKVELPKDEEKPSSWFGGSIDWKGRAAIVRNAFKQSWRGYEEHGWGEFKPKQARPSSGHC